ncbi:MAG TPA: 50S ribosomal protein L4 [Bacteroidales bacterium]|nr:50S ribosomal protein L4 [Bacteroidales bacterium]HOU96027.1 50S ribosomal protein L4 [Bacteroidales bacterium]HQG35800.1 50S ribosomal protein L4 [Bacteroidales bacterium]HQG53270.1 50S ribosomal protein L4 [Bacteroidales bacterium]HQJ20730.1 50S ribosomal protein L4 [Bacteroidales bacterium]
MELNVYNIEGKDTGKKVILDDSIFAIKPNDHAIYLDTKQFLANIRQGTAKAKERSEITGSTRKLKRQKGTGSARYGDIKNPLFRGGGRIFGPRPRDYNLKLNKKVKQLARKSALSYKAAENGIIILEDFNIETPKTHEMVKITDNLQLSSKKSIFVLPKQNKNIYLSSRNLQGVEVVTVSELNTYKIMNASILVLSEGAIDILQKTFKN